MGTTDKQRSDISFERYMAFLSLHGEPDCRPTRQGVWWVLAATEKRIPPTDLARRLDGYVERGANRARIWAIVAWKLRWARNTRLADLDLYGR